MDNIVQSGRSKVLIVAMSVICPAMAVTKSAEANVGNAIESISTNAGGSYTGASNNSSSGIFNSSPGSIFATFTSPEGDYLDASGLISGGADPVLSVNATLSSGTNLTGTPEYLGDSPSVEAAATLTYFFRVVGPAGSVPIIIHANGSVYSSLVLPFDSSPLWGAEIGISVYNDGSKVGGGSDDAGFDGLPNSEFLLNLPIIFDTSDSIDGAVVMTALASNDPYAPPYGTAQAILDPTITIDPSFPNANEYSVELSPNLISDVPEPASLCILQLGRTWTIGPPSQKRLSK